MKPATVEPLMWDSETTAAALSVPRSTIENLHRTRQLEGFVVGRHLRFRPSDVRQFVDELQNGGNGRDGNGS